MAVRQQRSAPRKAWPVAALSDRRRRRATVYPVFSSASRSASRFGLCQPFSDPLGAFRNHHFSNEYGVSWSF